MKGLIVIGLGNPGLKYETSRHNLGFMLSDFLTDGFKRSRNCPILMAKTAELIAVKPLTYMNRSGLAVKCILEKLTAELKDILVACDDFNLPLGKLRLRSEGSGGGHNGLQSVIDLVETSKFPRLRMGIGGAEIIDKTGFVLERFKKNELEAVENMLIEARHLIYDYIRNGIKKTMGKFN